MKLLKYTQNLQHLLLLSIYGLVPSFNEDEVLKLFGLVSQHNITVELFGAMGFADKISGKISIICLVFLSYGVMDHYIYTHENN